MPLAYSWGIQAGCTELYARPGAERGIRIRPRRRPALQRRQLQRDGAELHRSCLPRRLGRRHVPALFAEYPD